MMKNLQGNLSGIGTTIYITIQYRFGKNFITISYPVKPINVLYEVIIQLIKRFGSFMPPYALFSTFSFINYFIITATL